MMSAGRTLHGRYASTNYPPSTYDSDAHSLLGPLLPTDSIKSKDSSSLYPARASSSFFHSDSSIDSLPDHFQQHLHHVPQQQPNGPDLLNENIALAQKNAIAQQEVASARNNQARLENQVYELDQTLAEARKETQRLSRAKKDFDRQLEQRTAAFERDRSLWQEREAELQRSIKFATRPLVVQAPTRERQSTMDDNEPDQAEVIPPQIQQQISENNAAHTRALRAQEKLVAELRKQILTMNNDSIERQRSYSLKASELQSEIAQARDLNRSLMEENESYQMLLHEKSMNGEFMQTSIMKSTGYNDDLLDTPGTSNNGSINLADELGKAFDRPGMPSDVTIESLSEEVKTLKESNTALGLYISKILTRIMENPHLQAILAADYSPRRASLPDSPPALIKNNGSNGSLPEAKKDERSIDKPEVGRARSRSLFSGGSVFSRSKPASLKAPTVGSNRSSSDEDTTSGASTGLASFQEGHVLEDSPRTSYSSSEFAIVANDSAGHLPRAVEYEQLTTFDQPFSRKQLQRHATLGSASPQERHQRRQTIGITGPVSGHGGGGHGRYGSESSALQQSQSRRSALLKAKTSLSVLAPTPESQLPSFAGSGSIPESPDSHEAGSAHPSIQSPSLSISTASDGSSGGSVGVATPILAAPTTPVVAEAGTWRKAIRRMSLFGSSSSASTPTSTTTPAPLKEGVQEENGGAPAEKA